MKKTKRWRPWLILFGLAGAGVGLLALEAALEWDGVAHELALAVGSALIVAAVLGATVDLYLKRELTRNAFEAAFGYLLPDALRGEIEWIYGQQLLCVRHEQTLVLADTDDPDLLTVTVELRRDLQNVGGEPVTFRPAFALDEWFYSGKPTRITTFRCMKQDGGRRIDTFTELGSRPFAVDVELDSELRIRPGDIWTIWASGHETRRRSGARFDLVFEIPTCDPVVTVRPCEDIDFDVFFGSRGQERLRRIGPNTCELPGTLLPNQLLSVRWWRRPSP
jgi:hypothetical protein